MASIPVPGSYVMSSSQLGNVTPRAVDMVDPMVRRINESSTVTINKNGDIDMIKKTHVTNCPLSRVSESLSSEDVQLLTKSLKKPEAANNLRSISHNIQVQANRVDKKNQSVSNQISRVGSQPMKVQSINISAANRLARQQAQLLKRSNVITGIGIPQDATVKRITPSRTRNLTKTYQIGKATPNLAKRAQVGKATPNLAKAYQIGKITPDLIKRNVKTASSIPKRKEDVGYKTLQPQEMPGSLYSDEIGPELSKREPESMRGLQELSDSAITLKSHTPSKLKVCTAYAQDDVKLRPHITLPESAIVPDKATARPHSIDHSLLRSMFGDDKIKKKKWGFYPESSLFKSSIKKKLSRKVEVDGIFSPARFYDGKKHKRFELSSHVIEPNFNGIVDIELVNYDSKRKIRVGMINAENVLDSPVIESHKSKSVLKALAKKMVKRTIISFQFKPNEIFASVNGESAQSKLRAPDVDYIPYIQIGSKMNAKITITRENGEPTSIMLR